MSFAEPYTKKKWDWAAQLYNEASAFPPSRLGSPAEFRARSRRDAAVGKTKRRRWSGERRVAAGESAGFCPGEITAPGAVISGSAAGVRGDQDFHFSTVN